MPQPKNRWIVCADHVAGPLTAGEAAMQLDRIKRGQSAGDRSVCKLSHSVKVSATKPKTSRRR